MQRTQKRTYDLTRPAHLAAWAISRRATLDTAEKELLFGIMETAIKDIGTPDHSALWWRENLDFYCMVLDITPETILLALDYAGIDAGAIF